MTARSIHIGLNSVDPNAYDGWAGQLSGCINDATDFQRLADKHGYETRLMTDNQATSISVFQQITDAAQTLRAGGIILITYSGHGSQVYDATSEREDRRAASVERWREVAVYQLFNLQMSDQIPGPPQLTEAEVREKPKMTMTPLMFRGYLLKLIHLGFVEFDETGRLHLVHEEDWANLQCAASPA